MQPTRKPALKKGGHKLTTQANKGIEIPEGPDWTKKQDKESVRKKLNRKKLLSLESRTGSLSYTCFKNAAGQRMSKKERAIGQI